MSNTNKHTAVITHQLAYDLGANVNVCKACASRGDHGLGALGPVSQGLHEGSCESATHETMKNKTTAAATQTVLTTRAIVTGGRAGERECPVILTVGAYGGLHPVIRIDGTRGEWRLASVRDAGDVIAVDFGAGIVCTNLRAIVAEADRILGERRRALEIGGAS